MSFSLDVLRGSIAIPMTPFDENGRIDVSVLEEEIEFCVESGTTGICVPIMVSEFETLSEEERKLMVRVSVEVSNGRVPIIANCAANNIPLAIEYAEYFEKIGADAVMAMPPYLMKADFKTIYNYYKAISNAVSTPIMLQNSSNDNVAISDEQVVKICEEIDRINWIKEEKPPSPESVSNLVSKRSPSIRGVFSGLGGLYLFTERERGAKGIIVACQFCDVLQKIWNLMDEGAETEAVELWERLLPAIVLERLFEQTFMKEIMIRRGIFKNRNNRLSTKPLSKSDMAEIDRVWERIEPILVWRK